MIFVIDASVAIKWFVEEPGRESARAWLESSHRLVAPDFLRVEIANTAWKKRTRGDVTAEQAMEMVDALDEVFDRFEPASAHLADALKLAGELSHPVYDCLYLACAEALATSVVTADRRLVDVCVRQGRSGLVRWFEDAVPDEASGPSAGAVVGALPDIERLAVQIDNIVADWPGGAGGTPARWLEIDAYVVDSPAYRRLADLVRDLSDSDRLTLLLAVQLGMVPRQPFGAAERIARAILANPDTDVARQLARYVRFIRAGIQILVGELRARPSAQ